jgi:hypothetical protein
MLELLGEAVISTQMPWSLCFIEEKPTIYVWPLPPSPQLMMKSNNSNLDRRIESQP